MADGVAVDLGKWLETAGMSQAEFGSLVGAGQAQISKYVHGALVPPRPVMVGIIAVTAGLVTADDFYAVEIAAARARTKRRIAPAAASAARVVDRPAPR